MDMFASVHGCPLSSPEQSQTTTWLFQESLRRSCESRAQLDRLRCHSRSATFEPWRTGRPLDATGVGTFVTSALDLV